ncbi:MAG TPA: hypothetical protein VGJ09_04485, partial [Bryobacteraceae bacterium]
MGEIRAFAEDQLPEVAALYLRRMRGKDGPGSAALQQYFREIFLVNPWAAPDISSLVYLEQGKIAGFLGVIPRSMEFEGQPIRVAATSQLMTERGPAGLMLLAHLFRGPQQLTYGDGASEHAHKVFVGVGGRPANLYSFSWLRPLRPVQTACTYLDRAGGALKFAGRLFSAAAVPFEYLISKLPAEVFQVPQSPLRSQPVGADQLLETIHNIGWRDRLKPVYEPASFRWLISQAGAGAGKLQMATLSNPEGAVVGWYVVYFEKRPGPAHLYQIGVARKELFDSALSAVFRDAWLQEASAVQGQAIPQHLTSLTNQYCLFRHANTCAVFHSRDARIQDAIYRGQAAFSRL